LAHQSWPPINKAGHPAGAVPQLGAQQQIHISRLLERLPRTSQTTVAFCRMLVVAHGNVTKARLRGGEAAGDGVADVVEAGPSHSSQSPPSFLLIQLSSPQLVQIV